jgi:hypothetical protein
METQENEELYPIAVLIDELKVRHKLVPLRLWRAFHHVN